jgi:hypothetical protein
MMPDDAWAAPATAVPCPACGHNLITNPGAEAAPGTNDDAVVKVPGWKGTGGFTAAQYAWSGGDLSATTPGPKDRGKNYFYGGPSSARSTGTQVIDVASRGISTGRVQYALSAWLGGYSAQGDDATLVVSFESVNRKVLSTVVLGPVTMAQRDDNSELLLRQRSGPVPSATRVVNVQLIMVRYSGSDNDGMADNLSLVFS